MLQGPQDEFYEVKTNIVLMPRIHDTDEGS